MAKNLGFLVIVAIGFFIYGLGVGVYHIFPYDVILEIKYSILNENKENAEFEILTTDVESLIHISNQTDIDSKQISLIKYIWKNDSLPNHHPYSIEMNIVDNRYDLSNLDSIDKITVSMKYDVKSISYLFHPKTSNNHLIIYQEGHAGDFINGKKTIQYFLEKNYTVLAFSMPLTGLNNQPVINDPNFGIIKFDIHEKFKFLDSDDFSPISYFVEPIWVSLNYLDKNYDFESYDFIGLSGGGWTAVIYGAIDDRISKTFSVAGSAPFYLRTNENFGDYEQNVINLYRIANYLELYTMDSHGENRELVQIFNKYDPCCFSGDLYLDYESVVSNKVNSLGPGSFKIFIDDSHHEHKISERSLEIILESLEN